MKLAKLVAELKKYDDGKNFFQRLLPDSNFVVSVRDAVALCRKEDPTGVKDIPAYVIEELAVRAILSEPAGLRDLVQHAKAQLNLDKSEVKPDESPLMEPINLRDALTNRDRLVQSAPTRLDQSRPFERSFPIAIPGRMTRSDSGAEKMPDQAYSLLKEKGPEKLQFDFDDEDSTQEDSEQSDSDDSDSNPPSPRK